jgi:hypothetical protein
VPARWQRDALAAPRRDAQPPKPPAADPDAVPERRRRRGAAATRRVTGPGRAARHRGAAGSRRLAEGQLPRLACSSFTERANADDACRFHPGPPAVLPRAPKGLAVLQQGAWPPRKHSKKRRLAWTARAASALDGTALPWHRWCMSFDEFMNIPPCTTGRHNADADAGGYAKSR